MPRGSHPTNHEPALCTPPALLRSLPACGGGWQLARRASRRPSAAGHARRLLRAAPQRHHRTTRLRANPLPRCCRRRWRRAGCLCVVADAAQVEKLVGRFKAEVEALVKAKQKDLRDNH